MRVALLYAGLPRMWRECHETQLRLFPGAEIDVFFHFWDTISLEEKRAIITTMRPVSYVFERPVDFSFIDHHPLIHPDNISVPSRMMSQYMSWRKVATLFQPYLPNYQLAVRSRSDLYFFGGINYDLANVTDGNISLVVYHWPENLSQLSELFAVGKPASITYFLSLVDRIWEYAPHSLFTSEALMTRHLLAYPAERGKFVMYTIPRLPFFVFRPHMVDWPMERRISESPGVTKWHDPEVVEAHKTYHGEKRGEAGKAYVDHFARTQISNQPGRATAPAPGTDDPIRQQG